MLEHSSTHVLGLIFDNSNSQILLIKKNRPLFMKGLLNGIGGKIEENESSLEAISRETKEETNLDLKPEHWTYVGDYHNLSYTFNIDIYATNTDISKSSSLTDEILGIYKIKDVIQNTHLNVTNLHSLILLTLTGPYPFSLSVSH